MAYRRDGITAFHPVTVIATWFGVGLLPKAPGTWGSLVALPLGWGLAQAGGGRLLLVAATICFVVGWWAAREYVWRTGVKDPSEVVIDEVAGQWLVLAATPLDPVSYGVAFLLFRLFDIWKPGPIRQADRSIGGGLGVMLDDILAAFFALIGMVIFRHVWPLFG
ncbi:phosphatidylglycerophosphatase A family protein [Magnetospirillum molischianum]|uniref:Phosphatidylglycerophosphatase A n=1 Tax=Magnetospirillum molischianum DSM 120 TaxID=1150626 RepID=H8FV66_MAGML|nr:phosphatidylglycerophosphatase A [Magnetospirillum molischianum]CCG42254.1 Phosphatidylglycerophosphatase A [Magnetospirillum molischianum DSM 120]